MPFNLLHNIVELCGAWQIYQQQALKEDQLLKTTVRYQRNPSSHLPVKMPIKTDPTNWEEIAVINALAFNGWRLF